MSSPGPDDIELALQTHLEALLPHWSTKLLGVTYSPSGGPYQRGTWMPARRGPRNEPVAFGTGAYHRLEGIYQIDLFYPKSERRTDMLFERAKAMSAHFYPDDGQGGVIEAGPGHIHFDRKPIVSALDEKSDAAYNRLFLEVFVRIEQPPG